MLEEDDFIESQNKTASALIKQFRREQTF